VVIGQQAGAEQAAVELGDRLTGDLGRHGSRTNDAHQRHDQDEGANDFGTKGKT